ncbi:MAG: hypothetical protein GVY18_18695 [Bacteroidetes bacterium]|jgi:hypothetical protein|nr:hypothetical protein [Bacteroidota bacterium]
MDAPTLHISLDGLHSTEVASLRRFLDTKLRNVEIRQRYDELRGRGVQKLEAINQIANEYAISESAVDLVLWPR